MNYLTAREARARLGISRDTLTKLIKGGELKASKIGNGRTSPYRIADGDLQEYLDRQALKSVAS